MRILVFAAFYFPYKGGYVFSLHEVLKGLVLKGNEVTVITCNTHRVAAEEEINGVKIFRIPCWNPRWLNGSYPLPNLFSVVKSFKKIGRVDVISTQTRFFPTTWLGFLLAKINGIPVVHTERGSQHPASGNWLIGIIGKAIDHSFGWIVCRFSDAVVGVSQSARVFAGHLGAKNPMVIYNSVDVDFWDIKYQHHSEEEITFLGRLVEAKGAQDLIKAFHTLNFPNFRLNIIGDGPHRENLEQLVRDLNLRGRVIFWGELSLNEIRLIFARTTVFVNPSYSEGLPRSVLEAAAAGLPIVATDIGGTREIICTQDHGVLVYVNDIDGLVGGINLLLINIDLRKRVGQKVREYVKERFNSDLAVNNYHQLYVRHSRENIS